MPIARIEGFRLQIKVNGSKAERYWIPIVKKSATILSWAFFLLLLLLFYLIIINLNKNLKGQKKKTFV